MHVAVVVFSMTLAVVWIATKFALLVAELLL